MTGCPFRFGRLGYPDKKRVFVFNGDYVDRGSWGVELLTLLTCLKLACPTRWGAGAGVVGTRATAGLVPGALGHPPKSVPPSARRFDGP